MKKEQKIKLYIALGVVAVVCIIILAVIGIQKLNEQEKDPISETSSSQSSSDELSQQTALEKEKTVKSAEEIALDKAKSKNPDTVAWINIPNTDINQAVMQSTDNEYYLYRDESGKENTWGSYFADYYANFTSPDSLVQNTVIYGHTANDDDPDGEKFSQLFRYTQLEFLEKNPNIYLAVGNKKLTFEIFAVYYTDIDFYYIDPNPTDRGFDSFMQDINARNEYVFDGSTVTEEDKLLTLSGCTHKFDKNITNDHRFVVMAKLVEDDAEKTTKTITKNPNPKQP